jgi:hypothetical protein
MNIVKLERPKAFAGIEQNDCGVHALAAVLCIPYEDALLHLLVAGRKQRHGTYRHEIESAAESLGYKFGDIKWLRHQTKPMQWVRPTVTHVLDNVPARGHFLMGTRNHWFAIVDGVIYDNGALKPRTRVLSSQQLITG